MLRFLVDETVGELILKPHISALLTAHPSLTIELRQRAWTPEAVSADIDVALQYAPALSVPGKATTLGEQRLLTCASPHYLREHGVPQHPIDLERHRHEGIVVSDGMTACSPWEFADGADEANVEVLERAITPSLSAALALALGGAGICRVPACWAAGHVRSGKLIRLLPDWELSLTLIAFEPDGRSNPYTADLLRFTCSLLEMGAPTRPC